MRNPLSLGAGLSLMLALGITAPRAEEAPAHITGQQKAAMINAARADVYAQLAREIKGLNITDKTVVANAVTAELARSGFVEAVLRGVEIGKPVFLEDVCLLEGKITLDQIVENLTSLSASNNGVKSDFESIKRFNSVSVVKARGSGTLPSPGGSGGGGVPDSDGLEKAIKALKGPGQPKLMAVDAARLDAYTQLAAQLKGVNVSDETTLYNYAQTRWTEATTSALVKGAHILRYYAMGDDLLGCEVEITLQQVVENIQKSATIFSDGREVTSEKIRRFNPNLVKIKATGYGALGDRTEAIANPTLPGFVK